MNLDHVNLADYPIDRPESVRCRSVVDAFRDRLSETGLINLEGFLTPDGVATFRSEIDARLRGSSWRDAMDQDASLTDTVTVPAHGVRVLISDAPIRDPEMLRALRALQSAASR